MTAARGPLHPPAGRDATAAARSTNRARPSAITMKNPLNHEPPSGTRIEVAVVLSSHSSRFHLFFTFRHSLTHSLSLSLAHGPARPYAFSRHRSLSLSHTQSPVSRIIVRRRRRRRLHERRYRGGHDRRSSDAPLLASPRRPRSPRACAYSG